tara:strand:+ start:901 stop:1107 length:207 start_codon:yes stop_codon:yes gene_type:complete
LIPESPYYNQELILVAPEKGRRYVRRAIFFGVYMLLFGVSRWQALAAVAGFLLFGLWSEAWTTIPKIL